MAHMIETMAYTGEVPWHGLGVKVLPNTTPDDMVVRAGLNWKVVKKPIQVVGGKVIPNRFALTRDSDGTVFDISSKKYVEFQNSDAFKFFERYTKAGRMTMETAGSIDDGKRIWGLARIKHGDFAVSNQDKVESFLLLALTHKVGEAMILMPTSVRVVCNNTYQMAMKNQTGAVRVSHLRAFDENVQRQAEIGLGLSAEHMKEFKDSAKFLASKRATEKTVDKYFVNLFQSELLEGGKDKAVNEDDFNRTVVRLQRAYQDQPGKKYSDGTWWTAFNAVTYYIDHHAGPSTGDAKKLLNNRMRSAWFGGGGDKKREAMRLAVEMAKKSKAA